MAAVLDAAASQPIARRRRQIIWHTVNSGISEPWSRYDIYPDDDDDRD